MRRIAGLCSVRCPWRVLLPRSRNPGRASAKVHSLASRSTSGKLSEDTVTKAVRDALEGVSEIELTVTGRRTGRQISRPVWFVQEDESIFLVPITGSDSQWYRNVRQTPMIQVSSNGMALSTSATPITDADRVDHVVDMFREKYGADQVEAHYPKHDVAVQVSLM
ncbi:nitroreductase/quinone reductase family protein [Micromonospora sp. RTP1Z1]|uniref:nitroreductase/quinone reductase family protein n=1 Tax=Micromonospora sp. RTP1Z1 TaxID=2994043 RepID=UPI0029C6C116|nr:nitroreductase/quinone reductase family protein [Micromonospora sp. RTP1Z1]